MELTFITLATFALVTAIVLSGYLAVTAESPVAQRLQRLTPGAALADPTTAGTAASSGWSRRFLAGIGQYGVGSTDRSLSHTLSVAGYRGASALMLFLGIRTIVSFGPALVVLVPQVSSGKPLGRALLTASVVWLVGHALANYWLRRVARGRALRITEELPDALDLMVVCLEAGLGLNATIARVGEERSTMDDPLGNEFSQVASELREGRSREDALRGLGARNGVDDLKALAGLIIQSDRLGASMGKTLRSHADLLRTKRRQRAEEVARKLPIKMLFPLALFILPALLITAAGPALLGLKELVRVMAGH